MSLAISELRVRNFLRVRDVTIEPDGSLVVVAGRNAQGKSSVLAAIDALFGGKSKVPGVAVHRGEKSGEVEARLSDGRVVRRGFTESGGTTLTLLDATGKKVGKPQEALNAVLGALSSEPLAFATAPPARQQATLATLAGIDLEAAKAERARIYEARTESGREVKRLQGVLASTAAPDPDTPTELVDVSALLAEQQAMLALRAENEAERDALNVAEAAAARAGAEVARLRAELAEAEQRLAQAEMRRDHQAELVASLVDPDVDAVNARLEGAAATNQAVQRAEAYRMNEALLREHQADVEALTEQLAAHDAEQAAKVAAASLPAGLSLGEEGVLLNGLPLGQASQAETIRVCFAIAAAEAPDLSFALVRDGSLLDAESRALIAEEAARLGCQLWLEVVGDEDGAFVIENGAVAHGPEAFTEADEMVVEGRAIAASIEPDATGDLFGWADSELPGMWESADYLGGEDIPVRGPDWTRDGAA